MCQVKGGCHLSLTKALFTWWEYNNNIRNLFPAHNVLNGSQLMFDGGEGEEQQNVVTWIRSFLSWFSWLQYFIPAWFIGGFLLRLVGSHAVGEAGVGRPAAATFMWETVFTWIVEPVLSFKTERVVLVWWPLKMELFYSTWSFLSSKIQFFSLLTVFVGPHVCWIRYNSIYSLANRVLNKIEIYKTYKI